METEHKAQPLSTPGFLFGCLNGGAPLPLKKTQMRKNRHSPQNKLKSIHPVLLRWIHRCHHIDRSTTNATPHAPYVPLRWWRVCPARHLSGFFKGIMYQVWWIEVCGEQILEERDQLRLCRRRVPLTRHAFHGGWCVCVSKTPSYFFQLYFFKKERVCSYWPGWGNDWLETHTEHGRY